MKHILLAVTVMRKTNLISFAVSLIMVSQAVGYNIQIAPEHPTSCDIVVVTLSGDWGSSCIPNDSAISVVGNDIYFDAIWDYPPDVLCLFAITPWEMTRSVGPLSPGTYTVYARIVGHPIVPETYVQVAQFIVSDKQFVLSTKSLTVPEGNTASFTVSLMMDPCDTVEVTVAPQSGDPDITVESGGTLFFNSLNYSIPQTVKLAAAEDEDYLNGQAAIQISTAGFVTAIVTAKESDNYYVPTVLYVDADAHGSNNGRSWTDAYVDLQEALSLAAYSSDVEEIHVAEGIYRPAGPSGSAEATFQLVSGVAVKGGYAGCGQPDPNTRDIQKYETILSGDLNGDDGPNFTNLGENIYHVVTGSSNDATAILDGFTITAGKGGGSGSNGGGMYNEGNETAPTVVNCTFKKNSAAYGAGVYCGNGSSLTLFNCTFSENSVSWYGGGIECWSANRLTVINCIFIGNSAGEGGGIYIFSTDCSLTNCIFSQNLAVGGDRKEGHGGGVCNGFSLLSNKNMLMTNCTFNNNSSVAETGGGIYYAGGSIINCIFWGNHASGSAGESAQIGIITWYPSFVNYCCIQGWTGVLGGSGNIGADPLFIDPNNGDYHLLSDSPCIDSGDPNYAPEPNETDLDGRPRIIGGRIDMGAYEFNHQPVADASPDQTAYAWIDGIAEVNLDGSGSYDEDGDELVYLWTWSIDGNTYDTNGVNPTIELPVGRHIISLIVNDGLTDSEPNEVNITVIGPIEANLRVMPKVLNCRGNQPRITTMLRLPKGITKDQIDTNQPILLYPGEIEAVSLKYLALPFCPPSADLWQGSPAEGGKCRALRTVIFALFDTDELMDAIDGNGRVELVVVGQLKTGQFFFGSDTVRVICPGKWPYHRPWCNHRWNRWCQRPCNSRH